MTERKNPKEALETSLLRWRLMLGSAADGAFSPHGMLPERAGAMDAALSWLYDRDPELSQREILGREGNLGPSSLTVPEWLNEVHRLFPKETIERLERDALERYEVTELVTNPEVLARAEPNPTLLKAVLRTKHLMNTEVLGMARELVAKVVRELMQSLAKHLRQSLSGARNRRRSSLKIAKNFDAKGTIRENLRHFDMQRGQLVLKRPLFFSRVQRHCEPWQVILLVDESASMIGSVIHAAVTAACLWNLPGMRTHLCIFDTEVVDLSDSVSDPVSVLMKVQLGGGTDIGKALSYASGLITAPRRAMVVIISDFYEGANPNVLVQRVKALCEQGSYVLGLCALDEEANPAYNRDLSMRLADAGARMGAMTPGELASWIAEKINR